MRSTEPPRSSSASTATQRVAAMQIVAAVGADEHDLCVLEVASEEHEEIAGRPVGPVQVFDDEQQRHVRTQPLDHAEQVLEQPALVLGRRDLAGRAELGKQVCELGASGADDGVELLGGHRADGLTQGLHHRTVRSRAIDELEAGAGYDPSTGLHERFARARHQAGLAHARLAADQHDRRVPPEGGVEGRVQAAQLADAADELRTGDAAGHATDSRRVRSPGATVLMVAPGLTHGCARPR